MEMENNPVIESWEKNIPSNHPPSHHTEQCRYIREEQNNMAIRSSHLDATRENNIMLQQRQVKNIHEFISSHSPVSVYVARTTVIPLHKKYMAPHSTRVSYDHPYTFLFDTAYTVYVGRPNVYRILPKHASPSHTSGLRAVWPSLETDTIVSFPPRGWDCRYQIPKRQLPISEYKRLFKLGIESRPDFKQDVARLYGKCLGSWCVDDSECHAQVLAKAADALSTTDESCLVSEIKTYLLEHSDLPVFAPNQRSAFDLFNETNEVSGVSRFPLQTKTNNFRGGGVDIYIAYKMSLLSELPDFQPTIEQLRALRIKRFQTQID